MKPYNPEEVSIIVNGNIISGYADGTFINVTRDTDFSTDVAGADGEVARSVQNDRRGKIVVTLLQSSLGNAILSDLYQQQEDKKITSFATQAKDNTGGSLFNAKDTWLLKPADVSFGKGIEARAWTIRCADLRMRSIGQSDA